MASYTVVGASASPLFSEKPNLVRSAILRAAINKWPIVPTLIDTLISGYNVQPRKAFNYGATGGYHRGLLLARNQAELVNWDYVRQFLADMHGVPLGEINMTWKRYQIPNAPLYEWAYIRRTEGMNYDAMTGWYRSGLPGIGFEEAAITTDIFHVGNDNEERTVAVEYSIFSVYNPKTILRTDIYYVPGAATRYESDAVQVRYEIFTSTAPEPEYFTYFLEEEVYPDFRDNFLENTKSVYFPVAALMSKDVDGIQRWVGERPTKSNAINAKELKETKKLLDYSGINYDTVKTALMGNPDWQEVSRSFITHCLPISEKHPLDNDAAKYFYMYLQYVLDTYNPPDKAKHQSGNTYGFTKSLRFQEPIPSSLYITLRWDYIEVRSVPYREEYAGKYIFGKVINFTETYDYTTHQDYLVGEPSRAYVTYHDKDTKTARRIVVGNLIGEMVINFLSYETTPLYTLRMAFPSETEDPVTGIIFPLSIDVLNNMSRKEFTSVAMSGTMLINQSFKQVKLKWYERQDFLDAILVIVIVVSIVTMSPQLIGAAQAGVQALAMYILESVAIGYLINEAVGYVLGLLADAIGGEAALILAAVASAIAVAYGVGVGVSIDMPFAGDLLKLATIMLEKVNELTMEEFGDLQDEIGEYTASYKEQLQKLEEANDLLGDTGLDFLVGRASGIVIGESPDDFYARSLGTSTYNDMSIAAVTTYVDNKLTLPSIVSNGFSF